MDDGTPGTEVSDPGLHALNRLNEIVTGHWEAQVLVTACRLRLFDALATPASADALASAMNLHSAPLAQLLSALTAMGLIDHRDGLYANTDAARHLQSNSPISMDALAMWAEVPFGSPGALDEALRTGGPIWRHGFEENDPASVRRFCALMDAYARPIGRQIAETFDFASCACLLDVGGGSGGASIEIAKRHSHLRGLVMDRPNVCPLADEAIAAAGLSARFQTNQSDLFSMPYPLGADVALLSWVLHDWNDEHCLQILRRCREALPIGGALLISEALLDDSSPPRRFPALLSLQMLMVCEPGARERTESEYASMLHAAGFAVERTVRMDAPRDLIVARKTA